MSEPTLKPCPFCKQRAGWRVVFGRPVAGCVNSDCTMQPDTWLRQGRDIYDTRKVAKVWNASIKDKPA